MSEMKMKRTMTRTKRKSEIEIKDNFEIREILGSKMLLDPEDSGICSDLLKGKVREPAVVELLKKEIKAEDVVIDIGANIGYYVLLESQLVGPNGLVIAIEPVPENYSLLCKNIELNGLTNVKPYMLAIGNENGKGKLQLSSKCNWAYLVNEEIPRSEFHAKLTNGLLSEVIETNVLTLDTFIERENLPLPDFIRMDLEGGEIAVIEGAKNTLSKAKNMKIEMELHYPHFENPEVLTEALRNIFDAGFYQKKFISHFGTRVSDSHIFHKPEYRGAPHILLEKRPVRVLATIPRVSTRSGAYRALAALADEISKRGPNEGIEIEFKTTKKDVVWSDLEKIELKTDPNLYHWADVVIFQSYNTHYTKSLFKWIGERPLVFYSHNDTLIGTENSLNAEINEDTIDLLIFNSDWVRDKTPWKGMSLVLNPVVLPEKFKTETTREYVTLVNLSEIKGGEIFFELARRMPDVKFLGVEGWGKQVSCNVKLNNVTIIPSTPNIKEDVYAKTGILLMPSQYIENANKFVWTESWGMVGVEAMASGIPVIAASTPGLKESLGEAGIFVERTDLDGWESAIRKLLNDPGLYEHHSVLASNRSKELNPEKQIGEAIQCLKMIGLKYLQSAEVLSPLPPSPEEVYLVKNISRRPRERGGYIFYPGITVTINSLRGGQLREIKACSDLSIIKL